MTSRVNMIIQILGVALQTANVVAGAFPEYQAPIAVVVSAIQGAVGVLAHFVNPDGTPAQAPWVK